jgi:exosome complex component RRP4
VIGLIHIVAGNNWKVDIGGPYGASLHANNALRRPYSDDISEYMDIGDVISAEIIAFDRNSGPFLGMKGRGLTVLTDGMVLDVSPAKIPRIIGRRGSMINMINDHLKIQTIVGQNGRIWIRAPNTEILRLAIKAFRTIEAQAHTSKLTDRISSMLVEELGKIKDSVEPEAEEVEEESVEADAEPELEAEVEPEPEPESKPDSEPEPETAPEVEDTSAEAEAEKEEEKEEPKEEVSEE